jgi:hypothetical protein
MMIFMALLVGMMAGCTSIIQNVDESLQRKRFKSDHADFEMALTHYNSGDFDKACPRFESLSAASASLKIARRARLGEICCRLILANTPEKYNAAIAMWYDFRATAPEHEAVWDLALLDPLIVRLMPESTKVRTINRRSPATKRSPSDQTATPVNQKNNRLQKEHRQLQTEHDALKKKVQDMEELQRRMDAVVEENRSLKKKIKALEAIDQNIQKKKTEISAPGE